MAASYVCPTCKQAFEYEHNPYSKAGTHCECDCPHCKQALAWDELEAGPSPSRNAILLTGPQACTHGPDRCKRLNGLVPSLR